jgi:hypothetical protein
MKTRSFSLFFMVVTYLICGPGISKTGFCQLPGSRITTTPYKYLRPHFNGDPDSIGPTDERWIVFSAADNTLTYSDSAGSTLKISIDFLDYFYVIDKKGDFLHIAKNDKFSPQVKKLGSKAVDYGWINEKELLLWKRSLLNSQNLAKKAIIVNIPESDDVKVNLDQTGKVYFYNDPDFQSPFNYVSDSYNFFYVYKVTGSPDEPRAVLLGTKDRIEGYGDRLKIKGWVRGKQMLFWDTRFGLIPNSDTMAVKERSEKGVNAVIFSSKESAIQYRNGEKPDTKDAVVLSVAPNANPRLRPMLDHFPLLAFEKDSGIVRLVSYKGSNPRDDRSASYSTIGYTSTFVKGLEFPVWQLDQLYSEEEYKEILSWVDKLFIEPGTDMDKARNSFYNGWTDIMKSLSEKNRSAGFFGKLKSQLGLGKVSDSIVEMKIADASTLAFGTLGSTPFSSHKIKEIKNPEILLTQDLKAWFFEIQKKRSILTDIANMTLYQQKYSFTPNQDRYYWIPVNILP